MPSSNIARETNSRYRGFIGFVHAYGWGEGVYRVLLGKPEGRRRLERPRPKWMDNIRTDLQEVGCGYMDWIGLAQDRDSWQTLLSAVMNLRVPWNMGNFLTSCKPVSFSRMSSKHILYVNTRSVIFRPRLHLYTSVPYHTIVPRSILWYWEHS